MTRHLLRLIVALAVLLAPGIAAAQQPCTTDARRVVDELYRHVLERPADQGSEAWVRQLESGTLNVPGVVRGLVISPEYRDRFFRREAGEEVPYIRAINQLYRHLLGRQPDEAAARLYASMVTDRGIGAVVDSMLASRAYRSEFGDWGVPGSGGLRFCAPGDRTTSAAPSRPSRPSGTVQQRFRNMDLNNDGVISRSEWRGNTQAFAIYDSNRDGRLSGDEIRVRAYQPENPASNDAFDRSETFENMDWNNNNRVERSEWNGTADTFAWLDRNGDNVLSRAEVGANRGSATGTSGTSISVDATRRWTDTGIVLTAGDVVVFDADGTVRLSNEGDDLAGPAGSAHGRRAPDAPVQSAPAGGLIARVGNGPAVFVGDRRQVRAPSSGRLFLSVNDDYLGDNSGQYNVTITVRGR